MNKLHLWHTRFDANENFSAYWYCFEVGVEWYLQLNIHQRINCKPEIITI